MKVLKTISAMFIATLISFTMSAQAAQTAPAAKTDSKATTTAKPAAKTDSKAAATKTTPATAGTAKSDTKPANADARTKTGDKINKDLKGPKGGNYYLTPSGDKKYIPKSK